MVWAVLPGFSITTTIIGIRIRMSALTYANKLNCRRPCHLAKNNDSKSKALVPQGNATYEKQRQ